MYFFIRRFSSYSTDNKPGYYYVYQCFSDSTVQKIKMIFKST